MSNIAVATDSTSCIPQDLLDKYNIYVVPLYVMFGDTEYRDGVDIKPDEFYKRLRKGKVYPTTSGSVQGQFVELFEKLRGKVDGVVAIVLTSLLSACHSSAVAAKKMAIDIPIEIIDTRIAMIAQGFAVIEAAKVAQSGGDTGTVVKKANDVLSKVHSLWMLESLDYIRRLGRLQIPETSLPDWQNVKPLMTWKEGKLELAGKKDTKENAMKELLQFIKDRVTDTPLHISVFHGDDPDGAQDLMHRIKATFKYKELLLTEFTPIIGAHMGPGALGLAFYNE